MSVVICFLSTLCYGRSSASECNFKSNNKLEQIDQVPTCNNEEEFTSGKKPSYVWCVPSTYNNKAGPWQYRHITNSSLPWNYFFYFYIFEVKEVNDKKQTVTLQMYFGTTWFEPRLVINEDAEEWNQTNQKSLYIPVNLLKYFWYPDLEIHGMEAYASQKILKEMSSLELFKNKRIRYNARVDIKISCQMNFENYPLDSQHCPFRVGSYDNEHAVVNCTSRFEYYRNKQRILQYMIDIEALPSKYHIFSVFGKYWATCGFNIILIRNKIQIFFQIYVPSTLLVIVSWISFVIKPDVVPGRIALLVTTFLVLINLFIGVKSDAPKSTSLNAIDFYLVVCLGQVFAALLEYAIVLCKIRHLKNETSVSGVSITPMEQFYSIPAIIRLFKRNFTKDRLDTISLIIFPLLFVVFVIIYVNVYFEQGFISVKI